MGLLAAGLFLWTAQAMEILMVCDLQNSRAPSLG